MGTFLIILLLLGLAITVYEFVAANITYIVAGILLLAIVIIFILVSKNEKKNAQYRPVTLIKVANLPENEEYLYFKTLLLIPDGIYSFMPHDLGVLGIQTTSTYYKNLFDKGYYDRIAHGTYAINRANLQKMLDKYESVIMKQITRVKGVSLHKSAAQEALRQYEEDLNNIRVGKSKRIEKDVLDKYLAAEEA